MGQYTKDAVELSLHMASFIMGPPTDDTEGIHSITTKEPLWSIPAWSPGKQVKYLHFWKNIPLDSSNKQVATLLWIFRVNRGSYDKPHFYQINRTGIYECTPIKQAKEMELVTKTAEGKEKKRELVHLDNTRSVSWSVIDENTIYFDCPHGKHRVIDCTCEKEGRCRDCGTDFTKVIDTTMEGKELVRMVCPKCESQDLKPKVGVKDVKR